MDIEQCKEAYEMLKKSNQFVANIDKDFFLIFAETVLSELEKKEAIINEMSIYINSPLRIPEEKYCEFYNSDDDCCWKTDKECKDCIKEYFANKVEKEGIKE